MATQIKSKSTHGGARPNAGRHPKPDKQNWVTVSVILRRDTVDKLKDHGRRKLFGPYLQWLLDRHPMPSHEEYEAALANKPIMIPLKGRRNIPTIISAGSGRQRKHKALRPEALAFLQAYESINGHNT